MKTLKERKASWVSSLANVRGAPETIQDSLVEFGHSFEFLKNGDP